MLSRGLGALLMLAACGGAPATPERARCAGLDARADRDLAALGGCRRVRGDLAIGHAVTDLGPLAGLEVVEGSLRLGPSLELVSAPLPGLREVGGHVEVGGNPFLGGLYWTALERIGGDLRVSRNLSATTVALPALREVGGAVELRDSRILRRLDLAALQRVGGDLRARGLPALRAVVLPAGLQVGGSVDIAADSGAGDVWPARWRPAASQVKGSPRALQPGPGLR